MTRVVVCVLALDGGEAAERAVGSARRFGLDVAVGVASEEGGACPGGVNVHRIEWRDDFADARNQLADQVTADWLLWINDDETLAEYAPGGIDRLDEPFAAVWLADRKDYTPRPAIRLQRRRAGVRWAGAVNEALVAEEGGPLVILDELQLKAFGHEDPDIARRRLARNQRIVGLQRAAGADDFGLALEEARLTDAAEPAATALMAWLRAFKHPEAKPPCPGAPDPRVEIAERLCAYDFTKPARRLLDENPGIVPLAYALLAAEVRAARRVRLSRGAELADRLASGRIDRRYSFPRRLEGANADALSQLLRAGFVAEYDLGERERSWANPLRVGRYVIGPAHTPAPRRGRFQLGIEVGTVFGTGAHSTTYCCLLALDRLARQRQFRRILDVGTGSGVLAIAAAKTWPARVTAIDVNPVAVEQARHNVRANDLGHRVRVLCAHGLEAARLPRTMGFDLAFANLNKSMNLRYADALARCAAPGGVVVVSGLLGREGRHVAYAYGTRGFRLRSVLRWRGWLALVMEAPRLGRQPASRRANRRLARSRRARR
ncbi:MAG: 50S ribosomal protein L11 methyltransferase [Proteobacteria bacterium]|nr:50S ribosomal protein L11 methyltransferase [Pseudomonadota bacterium]